MFCFGFRLLCLGYLIIRFVKEDAQQICLKKLARTIELGILADEDL